MEKFYIRFRNLPYENYTTIIEAKSKKEALEKAIGKLSNTELAHIETIEIFYWNEV